MNNLLLADFDPTLLGFLVPVATFSFVICIIFIKSLADTQRRKLWHETARLALEKGQPIPIPPTAIEKDKDDNATEKQNPIANDIRVGLILLAIAAGLFLANREGFYLPSVSYFVTGFLGIAFLINAVVGQLLKPKTAKNETSSNANRS